MAVRFKYLTGSKSLPMSHNTIDKQAKFKILILASILLQILIAPLAVSGANNFLGFERKGELNIILELLIFALFSMLILANLLIYLKMGNTSIGKPFAYLVAGLSLLILNRVFFILVEFNQYEISHMTIHGWSHMIFYAGLFLLYLAISKVGERTKETNLSKIGIKDIVIISSFFIFAAILFLTAETYNMKFTMWFMGTTIHKYGLLHLSTYIILGFLILKLWSIKKSTSTDDFGSYVSPILPMFIGFLFVMFLNHTWKYTTDESIISVDVGTVRIGEQLMWFIGFSMLTVGFIQVYGIVNKISSGFQDVQDISKLDNPVVLNVLEILHNHVGSIASNVAIQSSQDLGINLSNLSKGDLPNFAQAIQKNTRDLIGDFPSRFLNQAILNSNKS